MKYEHGYSVIDFDGVEIPTFTFGGGNIRVTSGWEDGNGLDGVLFSLAPDNTSIGELINTELEGKKFTAIPNVKCYMRFDNPYSIDVVINKLTECKVKLTGETFFGRLVNEKNDLTIKITKLTEFVGGDIYNSLDKEDQELLDKQLSSMCQYHALLLLRLQRLMPDKDPQKQI